MFSCNTCDKTYKYKKSSYRHKRENHRIVTSRASSEFVCETYNLTYEKKKHLLSHMKIHKRKIRQSRLLCPIKLCQEKFIRYLHLHRHLLDEHCLRLYYFKCNSVC
jgi:uncharacterized Zn-finger protein